MKRLALLPLCFSLQAQAGESFDGYEDYYAALPGRLFSGQPLAVQSYSIQGGGEPYYIGINQDAGGERRIFIRNGTMKVGRHLLSSRSVVVFPGEAVSESDLDHGTVGYFAKDWTCVENTPSSASGTAVRYKALYLVRRAKAKPQAWKLPGLFAACAGIRLQAGQVLFDKLEYRYKDGQDAPVGVVFKEYAIQGNAFAPSGRLRNAVFVEPDNVYKFSIEVP